MSYYAGYVTEVIENGTEVSVMHKSEINFKWPQKEDMICYNLHDVFKLLILLFQLEIEDNLRLKNILNCKRKWKLYYFIKAFVNLNSFICNY